MHTDTDTIGYTYRADHYCPDCIGPAMTPHGSNRPGLVQRHGTEHTLDQLADAAGIDRGDESTFDSGDFPKIDSADTLRDGYADGGPDCCAHCGRVLVALDVDGSGPGKFEGNGNPHLAAYLYGLSLDGFAVSHAQPDGHVLTRVGDWIVRENDQGFVDVAQVDDWHLDRAAREGLGLE